MTYQALYRQWRPQTFAELVGQKHVAQTLQNALEMGRVAHAYLFCGPRGTGKTSAAKILAKAVNCEAGPAREPCNECPACREIQAGRMMDVLEIDAASNRGINEIRELREKVRYAPVEVRRKVYIIDEVHMLTAEAFNALLKTLEEPPGHVLFILATTEPHKLPATIISRCQRLDFHLLSLTDIVDRLQEVTAAVGRHCSQEALYALAEEAAGGLRDALSLLEQVLAYTSADITEQDVRDVLGTVSRDVYFQLTAAVLENNLAQALNILHEVSTTGKDFHNFTQQAISYYRDLMVALACQNDTALLDVSAEWAQRLYAQAKKLGLSEIGRILSILHDLLQEIRWASRPRLMWELAVFRIFGYDGTGVQQAPVAATVERPLPPQTAAALQTKISPVKEGIGPNMHNSNQYDLQQLWPRVLAQLKKRHMRAYAFLKAGEFASFDGQVLKISFASKWQCDMMEDESNKKPLQQVIGQLTGLNPRIECIVQSEKKQQAEEAKKQESTADLIQQAVEIFQGKLIDYDK